VRVGQMATALTLDMKKSRTPKLEWAEKPTNRRTVARWLANELSVMLKSTCQALRITMLKLLSISRYPCRGNPKYVLEMSTPMYFAFLWCGWRPFEA
jgi:hypothetical protein